MPSAQRALRRLRLEREAPLVGRRADLARLEEVYHRARGEGAVLLLSGPTGVGKSRLLYEFIEKKASAQGPQIAAGRCVGSGGRSYQPFLEALQDLLEFDAAGAGERRALLEEELLRLLPETPGVVPHFADFVLGGVQPGVESGFSKDALLSAYAGVLRSAAAKRPVVIAIEDLHLAGPESLELFSYLSRCIPGHPILLAGVFAEDEVEEGSALHELVARVAAEPCGEKLSLTPLPAGATEEIVRARVGNERAVRVLAWPLHEKSDGNPLIVLEMLNHLHTTGELVARDGALEFLGSIDKLSVPATVRELSNLKLGRLDEEQRETIEAAAVLGFEFGASLLAAVLEEKRIKLLKRLAVLERKHRLLRSSGKDSFRFASHRLFDATYAAISPALRVEYHAVVADTIRERIEEQEGEVEGEQAFALLRHLQEAERTLEAEPFLESAIQYLAEHYHASLAAHFLEKVAQDFSVARPQKRFAIAMKLWACYELLGKRKEQLLVLERGRELAEELGEPGPLGEVHSRLAVSYWHAGDFAKAEEEGRKGIALAQEAGRRRWESNSLHTLGVIAFRKGEFAEAVELWNEALNIRREIGDRRGEASSLLGLGEALPFTGEPERAMETKQESLAIFREIGDRRGECGILTNIGNSHADAWELEEAISCYERAVEIRRELGDSVTEAFPRRNLGRVYHMLGRTDDAREAFGRALLIFREMGHLPGELEVLTGLGPVLASVGEYEEARIHLEAACALAERLGSKGMQALAEGSLAYVLHKTGKREEAWRRYEKSLALAEETGSQRRRYVALFEMGSAALLENDARRATELLERAWEVAGSGSGADSGLLLCLCRLARACSEAGRSKEAANHAARAEELLAGGVRLTPVEGPEVHYILRLLSPDRDGGRLHLTAASDLIDQRTRAIRNDAHKEYYRTSIWPNAEILEEAEKISGE